MLIDPSTIDQHINNALYELGKGMLSLMLVVLFFVSLFLIEKIVNDVLRDRKQKNRKKKDDNDNQGDSP